MKITLPYVNNVTPDMYIIFTSKQWVKAQYIYFNLMYYLYDESIIAWLAETGKFTAAHMPKENRIKLRLYSRHKSTSLSYIFLRDYIQTV